MIAIVALLVGLLLPSLGTAREAGRAAVCLSNVRQIGIAVVLYAQEHKDVTWPPSAWARRPNWEGTEPGILYDYVQNADTVGECPSNRRRGVNASEEGNMFGGLGSLDFDYTMVAAMHGAKLALPTLMRHQSMGARLGVPRVSASQAASFTALPSPMLFVEESTYWYNDRITDGLWGNLDQIAQRHGKGGHVWSMDGSTRNFKAPTGPVESLEEPGDFVANDLYVQKPGDRFWFQLDGANGRPWGWVNNPR